MLRLIVEIFLRRMSFVQCTNDCTVKTKARGFEAFLIRATTVLGILFFGIAIILAILSTK